MLLHLAAIACLAAGLGLLAGPGWALLVLGALVYLSAPRAGTAPRWDEVADRLRRLARLATATPRRAVAVASMAAGVVGIPSGALLIFGAGTAVATAGVMFVGLGLLAGWE